MSDPSAVSPVLPPPQAEGWTRNKFLFFIAFALAFHVALIFIFGTKQQMVPRGVMKVPHLQLADNTDEFIALGDPTLFARPNAHDLVTAFWRRTPAVAQPDFNWTGSPRYLEPAPENFGAAFHEFMPPDRPADFPLDLKPEPRLIAPEVPVDEAMPQATTMEITGELAQRRLLNTNTIALPSLRLNDVIAPSRVQALVDTAGNVFSSVLLPSDSALEDAGRSEIGDSNALVIVRSLRFAPAPRLMFGEIIFNWHTVPTNAP
jgi:hypothetical protein